MIVNQLDAYLIGQREAAALVHRFGGSGGRSLRVFFGRRRTACGQHEGGCGGKKRSAHHTCVAASRPDLSSSALSSGSRPMKVRYSSAGSSLSPRSRIFSRNSSPTSRLKMPLSRK